MIKHTALRACVVVAVGVLACFVPRFGQITLQRITLQHSAIVSGEMIGDDSDPHESTLSLRSNRFSAYFQVNMPTAFEYPIALERP